MQYFYNMKLIILHSSRQCYYLKSLTVSTEEEEEGEEEEEEEELNPWRSAD